MDARLEILLGVTTPCDVEIGRGDCYCISTSSGRRLAVLYKCGSPAISVLTRPHAPRTCAAADGL
jgi:hypothetical protein